MIKNSLLFGFYPEAVIATMKQLVGIKIGYSTKPFFC